MELQSNKQTAAQAMKKVFKGFANLPTEVQSCIENCTLCHQACEQLVGHCLMEGGPHANADHIRHLQDCSEACTVAADFMLRGSDLHTRMCGLCADACQACAASCDSIAQDEMMKSCAEICRHCAESCQKMAKMH
jgi:hypothetical protein